VDVDAQMQKMGGLLNSFSLKTMLEKCTAMPVAFVIGFGVAIENALRE
jgi:hypothetical protein